MSLAVSWLAYEGLCRSPLGRHEVALALVGYVFLVALTFGFTRVFSGRGAYTQIGALIGTIMVANVLRHHHSLPEEIGRRAARRQGARSASGAQIGKQRSVHNNYLTLPVVFLMLSNHWPLFFATRYNWLIVAIVLAIGPVDPPFLQFAPRGQRQSVVDVGRGGSRHGGDRLALRGRARARP